VETEKETTKFHHEDHEEGILRETMKIPQKLFWGVLPLFRNGPCITDFPRDFVFFVTFVVNRIGNDRATLCRKNLNPKTK